MKSRILQVCLLLAVGASLVFGEIYGSTDNRFEFYHAKGGQQQASDLVVSFIPTDLLSQRTSGDYEINGNLTFAVVNGNNYCSSVGYQKQPVAAYCNGFLIAENQIATTSTCLAANPCEYTAFVFGYELISSKKLRTVFEPENVYFCQSVVEDSAVFSANLSINYAVLQMTRSVNGSQKYAKNFETFADVQEGETIYSVGNPDGLPLKFSPSTVQSIEGAAPGGAFNAAYGFVTELDNFAGQEGSPVFAKTSNKIIGIVASTPLVDYVESSSCLEYSTCSSISGTSNTTCIGTFVQSVCVLNRYNRNILDCSGQYPNNATYAGAASLSVSFLGTLLVAFLVAF